jgi:hypothetical protein
MIYLINTCIANAQNINCNIANVKKINTFAYFMQYSLFCLLSKC